MVNNVIFFYYSNPDDQILYFSLGQKLEKIKNTLIFDSLQLNLTFIDLTAHYLKKHQVGKFIIAGKQPGIMKVLAAESMLKAGKNPDDVYIFDFDEYGVKAGSDDNLIVSYIYCLIKGIDPGVELSGSKHKVIPETLIIGGGIAGIQAALEIAGSGSKVYIAERSGTIGGHMATFDKTFPTLDCSACILTPKMVEAGQYPDIELITNSEIIKLEGESGQYKVTILKKARRVNINLCKGCGECSEKCPVTVPNEFDQGTMLRKAIYIPFPQAVPNKYMVDAENCLYVSKGKCGNCLKACPVENCINLDETDETITLNVGNIIVATGFSPFEARKAKQYGYGLYPNVLTSLEFERLVNAAGPTGGKIKCRTYNKKGFSVFTDEQKTPESIAFIHCVGSRDVNYQSYCSKVCCMYTLKLAHLAKEKIPDAEVYEFYIDMRCFGKGYEEFYNRIVDEGIHIIRGRTTKIEQEEDMLIIKSEDIDNCKIVEYKVDMVVLSVGLQPNDDTPELAEILGLQLGEDGWFKEQNMIMDNTSTVKPGIFLAGACQGPRDIPDTVSHASAAAAKIIQSIMNNNIAVVSNKDIEAIMDK